MSSSIYPNRAGPLHELHEVTWQRLVTLYGYEHACRICDGEDEATNADLAAWKALGASKGPVLRVVRR